jgi:hypothetical protein
MPWAHSMRHRRTCAIIGPRCAVTALARLTTEVCLVDRDNGLVGPGPKPGVSRTDDLHGDLCLVSPEIMTES